MEVCAYPLVANSSIALLRILPRVSALILEWSFQFLERALKIKPGQVPVKRNRATIGR
jgi:hypothetical protein